MKNLIVVYKDGKGKRVNTEAFVAQNRGGSGVAGAPDNMEVADTAIEIEGDENAMVVTRKGKVVVFPLSTLRVTSRQSLGVRLMNVRDDDEVVSIHTL